MTVQQVRAYGFADGEAKGEAEGRAKGFLEGEAKGLAKALTEIMKRRDMPLSNDQFRRLRSLPRGQLPDLGVAFEVDSAEALLARAGSNELGTADSQ